MKKFRLLIILLFATLLIIGCKTDDNDDETTDTTDTTDTTAPTIATKTLTFSNVSTTSLKISWSDASDDSTSDASTLSYGIYQSSSSNIDTVTNIEANGTAVGDFSAGVTFANSSGLAPSNTYYFNVIVKDASGNKSAYSIGSVKTSQLYQSTQLASKTVSFPIGNYVDNYNGTHTISAGLWANGKSYYTITKNDTTSKFFIAQNGVTNSYNASKYSRFDWVISDSNLYYCQSAYDKDTAAEAEAVNTADSSDPTSSGCSSFAWSKLTPFNDVIGNFVDTYNGTHTISSTQWSNGSSTYNLIENYTADKYIIAQNGSSNTYNPSKYSRFDWVISGTDLYYCQIAYDKDTAAEAKAVNTAVDTSPSTGGCGSFAWSKITAFTDVVGNFADNYDGTHTISATKWINGTSKYILTKNKTASHYIIAQNGPINPYNPSKYSRFDWVKSGSDLYYCQSAYNKDSAVDAEAVTTSDSTDLTSGCSGFAWSQISTISDIVGNFTDNYKNPHTVLAAQWFNGKSEYKLTKSDTTNKFFIGLNSAGNAYNASKYSRFDWTKDSSSGQVYYCQSAYDKATAAGAEAVTTSDSSDPANSGCGGFAWSQLTP